jgi:iron complex outermembrane recepter protein
MHGAAVHRDTSDQRIKETGMPSNGQTTIVIPALTGLLLASTLTAHSQSQDPQKLDRVEVTGSSIKRIEAETALPVQVISREEIQRTGASTVEQLLQTISATSSAGGFTSSSASGATTGGISSTSLRGLASQRTLLLINGRRIAPYGIGFTNDSSSVDVNSIPVTAIERVEVLKDGASAVYGSDAIAGVINFILRRDFKGVEITAEYGNSTQGGGDVKRLSGTWGLGDISADKFNLIVVGSYQKEGTMFGRDRDFAMHTYNVGAQNDLTSGNTYPANIDAVDGSLGSRNPTAASGCLAPYSFISPLSPNNRCRFDPGPLVTLLPATERISLFAAGKFAITSALEAFVEASFNRNTQRTVIQPVPLSDQFTIPFNNPLANIAPYNQYTQFPSSTVVLTTASPFYPTAYVQSLTGGATPDLLVRYRSAVTGDRDITDISEAPRLTLGVKGTVLDWDIGYPIISQVLPLLNSGTVDFFNTNSPSIESQLRATNFLGDAFRVTSTLDSVGGKASRELLQLPAGPAAVALGAELRRESYEFDPSIQLIQGDLSGYGGNFGFVDRSRKVASLFAEANVPLVKGLDGNVAVRYDKYQGSGSSTTPKFSLRYQPVAEVLLRGSVGKGFRAPSLADLYAPATNGVSQTGLSDPVRCPITGDQIRDCQTQFPITNGGNPTLKSEKSDNITLGLVFEPTKQISVGIEGFKIRLKETISNGFPQAVILANLAKYSQFITRATPTAADIAAGIPGAIIDINQTNLNTGVTKLAGFDLDLKWRIPAADIGRVTLGFSGTYFAQYDTDNFDGTFANNVGNLTNATTGGVIPRWKTYSSANWSNGPWDTTVALNWQSSYEDIPGNINNDARRVSAYQTVDLQGSYSGLKNLRLTLGVRNVLDRDPPYTNQGFSFQAGYDPQYADPRGRFIYGRLTYSFH